MIGNRWGEVVALLEDQRIDDAVTLLDHAIRVRPADAESYMLRALARSAIGQTAQAEADLWRCLAVDPHLKGGRAALGDLFVTDETHVPADRNFNLDSGEQQTAAQIENIRADHAARYEFAARWLRDKLAPASQKTGGDIFCGNGYGSRILADRCGSRIIGIDGSTDSVEFAEQTYSGHRIVFRQAHFPFSLQPASLDFAVCFESVEYIEDCDRFLEILGGAVKGPLLLSFPLEPGLPYSVNRDLFRYHYRHFSLEEMSDKLRRICRREVVAVRAQNVYRLVGKRVDSVLAPSQMELTDIRGDSQIAVVVAERARS